MRSGGIRISGAVAIAALMAAPAEANRESQTLSAKAAVDVYNLDRDRALATYRQAVAADPSDMAAYRGLASALWLSITFRRGNMTVDDYLSKVSRKDLKLPPPTPETAAAFHEAVEKALSLARAEVAAHPKDPDAHFQLGSAIGLRASYIVTVEGRVLGAFNAAREAYNEHEKVLDLDPRRSDAGLIVGTYRYLVSAMSLPVRWMAYIAGFGGGKEKGMQFVRLAADFPGDNRTEARIALVLLDNREGKYDDALRELARLREEYPRNRLLWLETGATYLRAGHAVEAERFLNEGIQRLASDDRPRMFGEDALWYFKRGAARAALNRTGDATADLKKALVSEGRPWVLGRTNLELGKLAIKAGNRAEANRALREAITLCDGDNDTPYADEARRLIR